MASTSPAARSGLYADPREDWLALSEEILDPARPIVDPHHHLWDRGGQRYLIEDGRRHRLRPQRHCDRLCRGRSMYRARGPEAFRPVGEVEFANGAAAMSASGGYGRPRSAPASSVMSISCSATPPSAVLEAEIAAGKGRFRGIRHSSAWDADPEWPGPMRRGRRACCSTRPSARDLPVSHHLDLVSMRGCFTRRLAI